MENKRFSEYVQSTAFSLTLSRRMIDALYFCKRFDFIIPESSARALESRGLIRHIIKKDFKGSPLSRWELTDAGRAVLPLLKMAGLEKDYGERPEIPPPPAVKMKIKVDYK